MKTLSKIFISFMVIYGLGTTATATQSDIGPAGLVIGVREPYSIGGVHVLHSTQSGPSAVCGQYWNQDHPDVGGVAVAGDKFGDAVVWGDFDGNGLPDLAIGTPKDSSGSVAHGSVNVLYGTPEGLSATGSQYFDQATLDVGMREMDDLFGFSLAVGDFDNNGYDDLVIGVPGEAIDEFYNAGVLDVLYGSGNGLTQDRIQVLSQDTPGVYGELEQADLFGFSLAVGDFDGDTFDDLAVGVPYENIESKGDAGHVSFLYGSSAGLIGRDTYYRQDMISSSVCEQGDRFGFALAVGDFDNDGHDDLAVGVPYEYISSTPNAGVVDILYGTDSGFDDRDAVFYQTMLGIAGCNSEKSDLFGYSLAAGDLNGDGFSDLVIGSPGESLPVYAYGGLNVMYGSTTGLTTAGAQWFDQDSPGVFGMREAGDQFGLTLAVGDLNGDTFDDLLVGVPFEDMEPRRDAGIVNIFNGTSSGLEGDNQWISQVATGLGETEAYDMFGISLAIWPDDFPYTFTFLNTYLPLMLK